MIYRTIVCDPMLTSAAIHTLHKNVVLYNINEPVTVPLCCIGIQDHDYIDEMRYIVAAQFPQAKICYTVIDLATEYFGFVCFNDEVSLTAWPVPQVVTCVYCGETYPEGTASVKSEALYEHIKKCDKHPMCRLQRQFDIAYVALQRCTDNNTNNNWRAVCDDLDKIDGIK